MLRKIAPAIEAVLDWPIAPARMAKGAVNAVEVHCQARAELRAVRAVVRAAETHARDHLKDCRCAICRALTRPLHPSPRAGIRRGTGRSRQ